MKNNENSRICTHCATGKKDFERDKTTLFCSYIACLKDEKCPKYKPLSDNDCEPMEDSGRED